MKRHFFLQIHTVVISITRNVNNELTHINRGLIYSNRSYDQIFRIVVLFTESSDWNLYDESFTKFVYCEELLLRQAIWTMNRISNQQ